MSSSSTAFIKKALCKNITLTFAKEQDHSIKKLVLIIKEILKSFC